MLISYSHQFIFFHVAKTGGVSVRKALENYLEEPRHFKIQRPVAEIKGKPNPIYQMWSSSLTHATAREVKEDMGLDYDTYFSFAFVRNPWDWQVSMYHFLLKQKDNARYELISKMRGFEEYLNWVVQEPRPYPKVTTKLQTEMLCDENGYFIVDFIARFETLELDFTKICEKIGIKVQLPRLNTSEHADYRSYYTPAMVDLVAAHFMPDIEKLGYSFESFSPILPSNFLYSYNE